MPFQLLVNGKNFGVKEPIIYYIDEKPHEISMKHLTPGVIAVIVVVVVAIIAGIVVLVSFRNWKNLTSISFSEEKYIDFIYISSFPVIFQL